ncbi:hypothetical protein [Novosphingobium sp. KACC 22771]|uniref:hypothetical protein n=1 Tax=Novosphingobium sp. KACC 22771 TaxID=3025670 RepID=UPI0023666DDB|nr:hypothetical protein [Novosphingobium sp. KACC 22771]WDF71892.1 hypothetical protein PQ467_13965 [Novosphingobium sp. KACC 22771]
MVFNTLFLGLGEALRRMGGSALWLLALVALGAAGWQYHRAAHWAAAARAAQTAWDAERKAAAAATAAAQTRYRSLADEADAQHAAALAQGDARLAAYIAAHRLRGAAPDPARAAADQGAAISENSAAAPVLATITQADLTICDANYVYAQAAHDWANGLNP